MVWQNSMVIVRQNLNGFQKTHFVLANFCNNFIATSLSHEVLTLILIKNYLNFGKYKKSRTFKNYIRSEGKGTSLEILSL